jgi:hypothetical protein
MIYPACRYCLSWFAMKCNAFTGKDGWGKCRFTEEQRARMESDGRRNSK